MHVERINNTGEDMYFLCSQSSPKWVRYSNRRAHLHHSDPRSKWKKSTKPIYPPSLYSLGTILLLQVGEKKNIGIDAEWTK